jgi:MFS-type transporter involved in bile tolerance (Atg22 family)
MKSIAITIVAALGAFVAAVVAVDIIAGRIGVWRTLAIGIVAAPIVVLTAYAVAPEKKRLAAAIAFSIGAAAATYLLRNDYYPELYENAYEPTMIPLFATIASGAIALIATALLKQKEK